MSAPVKLPRRLPDREPVRSDTPSEVDWLRRAIRCCEHRGCRTAALASAEAPFTGPTPSGRADDLAGWLPEHLRRVPLAELRRMLDALGTAEAPA